MNNTTFSFNKKQIVQSVLEPDTHCIWLNSNDNKLYKFGNSGWEPISGTNIYRIFLMDSGRSDRLVLDPNHEKENTIARIAFNEDYTKYTNNVYLITYKDDNYGEITGIANCLNQEMIIIDFTTGINVGFPASNKATIFKTIITIDSEIFRNPNTSNEEIGFHRNLVSITADLIYS